MSSRNYAIVGDEIFLKEEGQPDIKVAAIDAGKLRMGRGFGDQRDEVEAFVAASQPSAGPASDGDGNAGGPDGNVEVAGVLPGIPADIPPEPEQCPKDGNKSEAILRWWFKYKTAAQIAAKYRGCIIRVPLTLDD